MITAGPREAGATSDRIRTEVERALQRSIKGVEYFSLPKPPVGATPKDVLNIRGTMNLYHYRPMVDEVYRVPILSVMATTNRGYILDLAPGQSLIEFLLKQGYDVYLLDWGPPGPTKSGCASKTTRWISSRIASRGSRRTVARGMSPSSAIASAAYCR
jgi:polyhydroxyalkanoate synthase subunit PhaC